MKFSELQAKKIWVCWREQMTDSGYITKGPYRVLPAFNDRQGYAKVNDPDTWNTYAAALAHVKKITPDPQITDHESKKGVGYVLGGADLTGIDLDDCLDSNGVIIADSNAAKILEICPITYIEKSASGRGLHILLTGMKPLAKGYHCGKVEIYDKSKYFALGIPYNCLKYNDEIATGDAAQAALDRIIADFCTDKKLTQKEKNNTAPSSAPNDPPPISIDETYESMLDRARKDGRAAKKRDGARLAALLDSGYPQGADPSAEDLFACGRLAWAFDRDMSSIDRAIRESALYRDKWDRMTKWKNAPDMTYGQHTIMLACQGCKETWREWRNRTQPERDAEKAERAKAKAEKKEHKKEKYDPETDWQLTAVDMGQHGTRHYDLGEWEVRDGKIYEWHEDKATIFSQMYITKYLESESDRNDHVEITYYDPSRELWRIAKVQKECINYPKIMSLTSGGLGKLVYSGNAKKVAKYLHDNYILNSKPGRQNSIPTVMLIDHLGWYDNQKKFALPDTPGVEFSFNTGFNSFLSEFGKKGKASNWLSAITPFPNNFYLRLTLAMSFASVLISPLNALNFAVYFWGRTGCGKSLLLQIGASVWGNPAKTILGFNGTDTYFNSLSAGLSDMPMYMDDSDELSRADNDAARKRIMQLAAGRSRGRAEKDGSPQERKLWHNILAATGEGPLLDNDVNGGAINRVLEAHIDETCIFGADVDIKNFVKIISNNYGHAGREFLEILAKTADLNAEFDIALNDIKAHAEATKKTNKEIQSLALLLLADRLAAPIFKDDCEEWGEINLDKLLDTAKDSHIVDDSERAFTAIYQHLTSNKNLHYIYKVCGEHPGAYQVDHEPTRELWGRFSEPQSICKGLEHYTRTEIYTFTHIFTAELKGLGFKDFSAYAAAWEKRGKIAITQEKNKKRYAQRIRFDSVRHWCVTLIIDTLEYTQM